MNDIVVYGLFRRFIIAENGEKSSTDLILGDEDKDAGRLRRIYKEGIWDCESSEYCMDRLAEKYGAEISEAAVVRGLTTAALILHVLSLSRLMEIYSRGGIAGELF